MSGSTLTERAAGLARPDGNQGTTLVDESTPDSFPHPQEQSDAVLGLPSGYPVPEQVPVHVAWHRVMCDVTFVPKRHKTTDGPRYTFRGVEDVVQAFSVAVRRHGVIVAPVKVVANYETSVNKNGNKARECDATVTWRVIGPMGDVLPTDLESAGEAVDYSDKSTTKAQSIAFRTLLVTLGMVATNDPEPEQESAGFERGEPGINPQSYLAEITNPYTSHERMRQIYNELGRHRLLTTPVEHEGQQIELGALLQKVGAVRWPKPKAAEHIGEHVNDFNAECPACRAAMAAADREAAEASQ